MSSVLLHLLRHGAPETPGLFMGRTDGVPTPAGIAACVTRAKGLEVENIVTSGLTRCDSAARSIGLSLTKPVLTDPRWRELDFGAWEGKPSIAIERQTLARFWDDPDANSPPDGERWSELIERIRAALGDIVCNSLVVTHGGAMRAALSVLCGFDHKLGWAVDLPYAALLSIRVWLGEQPTGQITGLRT